MPLQPHPDRIRCTDCDFTRAGHREAHGRGLSSYRATQRPVPLCRGCHGKRLSRPAEPSTFQFRHGPYHPPALRAGDRAFCEYRGRDVLVTDFGGPANWPRGRPERQAGRSAPIVTEELARAIGRERPRVICAWLGVSVSMLRSWRISLGLASSRTAAERQPTGRKRAVRDGRRRKVARSQAHDG